MEYETFISLLFQCNAQKKKKKKGFGQYSVRYENTNIFTMTRQ